MLFIIKICNKVQLFVRHFPSQFLINIKLVTIPSRVLNVLLRISFRHFKHFSKVQIAISFKKSTQF